MAQSNHVIYSKQIVTHLHTYFCQQLYNLQLPLPTYTFVYSYTNLQTSHLHTIMRMEEGRN